MDQKHQKLLCAVWWSVRSSRRAEASVEEDALGGIVAYEEEERVIGVKALWTHQAAHHHDGTGGCSGLRPLLIHFHK